ncbi:MAG: DUF4139 domain-containing protein [Ignavibacteria bacterium]|jgi:hypothetical protein|nr:DUF4139 domain-containing protein [Ignavibacteria bacterium]MCU7504653.1 DUF4139 domain-containing protein [Ignavibacteria bacterium]MCU7517539.1 DUF4139 domain-containing protein [Ignavibacteria bacterium]
MLKKLFIAISCFALSQQPINAQEAASKSVSVTVYNQNLGVIREVRPVHVNSGRSEISIRDVAQLIDPTSVHIKLDGEVLEQNYQYDLVSMEKILQKYLERDVQLIGQKDELLEGKLLSAQGGQVVLQKKDGGLIMLPNTEKYRISVGSLPEGLITRPTLVWTVNSKAAKDQDVEISYQTAGMNWHAEYVAILNENDTKLSLNAWVSIENQSGTAYKDASLKLVAGDVNLVQQRQPGVLFRKDVMVAENSMAGQQFQEREFFEYHMYDLERPATLNNNESKQISLFQADNISVSKKYLYKSGYNYQPYGQQNQKPKVAVAVEFENTQKNNLGMPMPKGKVRVNKSDGKTVEFIGEDMVDHTPKDEKIKLKIGDAFDIVAEETQTENVRISDKVYEQAYEIKLRNRKKEDVTVEVERALGLNWEMLSSSIDYQKKDAQTVTFKVPVKKGEETVLKFKVRYAY